MPKVAMYNIKGEEVGEVMLTDSIFNVPVRTDILHQVVTMQLANKRRGTASTKTRAEVRGGGRKPWRQKEPVVQDTAVSDRLSGPVVE